MGGGADGVPASSGATVEPASKDGSGGIGVVPSSDGGIDSDAGESAPSGGTSFPLSTLATNWSTCVGGPRANFLSADRHPARYEILIIGRSSREAVRMPGGRLREARARAACLHQQLRDPSARAYLATERPVVPRVRCWIPSRDPDRVSMVRQVPSQVLLSTEAHVAWQPRVEAPQGACLAWTSRRAARLAWACGD